MTAGLTLVCFAVKEEAGFFQQQAVARTQIKILITGIGERNAQKSIRAAIGAEPPVLVISSGFAGGLRPELTSGTIVFDADQESGLGPALIAAGAQAARIHCANRIASTAAEKRALRRQTGADAVDMESEHIRAVCHEHGIPSATVRVILDTAGEDLPLDFNALMNAEQQMDSGKLAWAVLKSPGKVGALRRLQKQSAAAAEALAVVLARVLPVD